MEGQGHVYLVIIKEFMDSSKSYTGTDILVRCWESEAHILVRQILCKWVLLLLLTSIALLYSVHIADFTSCFLCTF